MHSSLALLLLSLSSFSDVARPSGDEIVARARPSELVGVLPRGITSFGADALDGWLYVHGGYFGAPHKYSREGQSDEFYRVNLRDPRVVELLDGGRALQGAPLVTSGAVLVRAGGMLAENAASEKAKLTSVAEAAAYDPRTRTWSALPDLPRARSSHDMECVGGRVYAVGGWTLAGEARGEYAQTVAVLDPRHPEAGWSELAAPFRARALAAARLGSKLAAIGGMNSDGDVVADVRVLDVERGTWSSAPDFPGEPFGLSAVSIDGVVHASGKDGIVWRLAPDDTQWTAVASLAFPRFFHQLVDAGDGAIECVGGIDRMRPDGRVRHIERILGPREIARQVVSLTLPAPLRAKNREGSLVRGSSLYLFGGNASLRQHDFAPDDFADEAWELDLATLAWRERARLPERRQTLATSVAGDGASAFAVGGFAHDGEAAVSRRTSWRYDFEKDAWSAEARLELDVPRTQLGLARHEGALWVFGGMDYDPRRGDGAFALPLDVLVARTGVDPVDNGRLVPAGCELTTPRRAFACATLGGKAYLVGGMRERFAPVERCEAFDFATRRFTEIAKPRAPRVSAVLVPLDGKLYLAGGSSRGDDGDLHPDASIEVYDPAADRWSVHVEELPEVLEHVHAFALRGRLVVASTHLEGSPAIRLCFVNP